ncbi:MAG: hypothetical protein U0T74_01215 [Chitinophagales bacterium]
MAFANLDHADLFDEDKPYAFISSLSFELRGFRSGLFDVINKDKNHDHLQVYIDEKKHDGENDKPLTTVDRLIERINKSELVIVILSRADLKGRYEAMCSKQIELVDSGTLIHFEGSEDYDRIQQHTLVSFWEVELFRIALGGKPVYFLVEYGFELDKNPNLNGFFEAASWLSLNMKVYNTKLELFQLIKEAIRLDHFRNFSSQLKTLTPNQLNATLWLKKKNPNYSDYWSFPKCAIEKNESLSRREKASAFILKQLPEMKNEGNIEKRLSRLWFIYRELFRFDINDDANAVYLPHWNDFFSMWGSSSLWYGLHSESMSLGGLATFRQQWNVRLRIKANKSKFSNMNDKDYAFPAGSFASAYYSIGKQSGTIWPLEKAVKNCQIGLRNEFHDSSSLHTIMGKAYRQMAITSRGKFYCNFYSAYHLHKALRIRESGQGTQKQLAETQADWGFVLASSGISRKKGIDLMESSLKHLPDDGFKVRVFRDLATLFE